MLRIGDAFREGIARAREKVRSVLGGAVGAVARTVYVVTIEPVPNVREDAGGDTNSAVLWRLSRKHPELFQNLGPAALRSVVDGFDFRFSLTKIAGDLSRGAMGEVARRLRSGVYVTNTPATTARKRRLGHSTTPGVDTGQLANALWRATLKVE